MEDDTIFIIDEAIINCFFSEDNETYCKADLFFNYLSLRKHHKKAYMIPSLYKRIYKKLAEKNKEVALYFENWVEEADFIGESDENSEAEDTLALLDILSSVEDSAVILISDKFVKDPLFKNSNVISVDNLDRFLRGKKDFMDIIHKMYYEGSY